MKFTRYQMIWLKALLRIIPVFFFSASGFSFVLKSADFQPQGAFPVKSICKEFGGNQSPELHWMDAPAQTQSYALIFESSVEGRKRIQWIIYNIPSSATSLAGGMSRQAVLASGMSQGKNYFNQIGYAGPCPLKGQRIPCTFRIYALDQYIPLEPGISYEDFIQAIEGHVIASSSLESYLIMGHEAPNPGKLPPGKKKQDAQALFQSSYPQLNCL